MARNPKGAFSKFSVAWSTSLCLGVSVATSLIPLLFPASSWGIRYTHLLVLVYFITRRANVPLTGTFKHQSKEVKRLDHADSSFSVFFKHQTFLCEDSTNSSSASRISNTSNDDEHSPLPKYPSDSKLTTARQNDVGNIPSPEHNNSEKTLKSF